jgi:hypothetical protein
LSHPPIAVSVEAALGALLHRLLVAKRSRSEQSPSP